MMTTSLYRTILVVLLSSLLPSTALIYEEQDNLQLVINDHGKGFGEQYQHNEKSAMGLPSVRRRIEYLNGKIDIQSDKNGNEISVSIPLASA